METRLKDSDPPTASPEPPASPSDDGEPPDPDIERNLGWPAFAGEAALPGWRGLAPAPPGCGLPTARWNDWRWQIRNRLSATDALDQLLGLTPEERQAMAPGMHRLPVAVTPYYADLLAASPALRRTMIPLSGELLTRGYESLDPLSEEHDSPLPGLVHRYPDRVLFLATDFCSAYCRYCTRSRRVGKPESGQARKRQWDKALEYIAATPTVRDVLVSGGDPLTMPDAALDYLLSRLRAIPHVEMVRIGTKIPMVLPMRVTNSLTRMLKKHHPLFMSVHCTHPDELTPEARGALNRLADAGIPLGSQTVLLAGVNDDAQTMTKLMQGLLRNRVRPYYLYQCDEGAGLDHFRVPLTRGLDIMRALRGHTSGYAIPHFVVDLPGGGGKTPLLPDYLKGREGDELIFENYEGRLFRVHDPINPPVAPSPASGALQ